MEFRNRRLGANAQSQEGSDEFRGLKAYVDRERRGRLHHHSSGECHARVQSADLVRRKRDDAHPAHVLHVDLFEHLALGADRDCRCDSSIVIELTLDRWCPSPFIEVLRAHDESVKARGLVGVAVEHHESGPPVLRRHQPDVVCRHRTRAVEKAHDLVVHLPVDHRHIDLLPADRRGAWARFRALDQTTLECEIEAISGELEDTSLPQVAFAWDPPSSLHGPVLQHSPTIARPTRVDRRVHGCADGRLLIPC